MFPFSKHDYKIPTNPHIMNHIAHCAQQNSGLQQPPAYCLYSTSSGHRGDNYPKGRSTKWRQPQQIDFFFIFWSSTNWFLVLSFFIPSLKYELLSLKYDTTILMRLRGSPFPVMQRVFHYSLDILAIVKETYNHLT